MDILIIGGTYFLGRAFADKVLEDPENSIHMINRGSVAFDHPRAVQYRLDRHDAQALSRLAYHRYDAIVDFCAYAPGDISTLLEHLNADAGRYVFISTVDVYRRGTEEPLKEDAPFEDRDFGGEIGQYILGKVALEREVAQQCAKKGIPFTSIRPSVIYGPGNYAPREGIYFNWIGSAGQILHPSDATGFFQMVYVDDVAKAILGLCRMSKEGRAEGEAFEAFNICPAELTDYESFADALKEATGTDFERVCLTVEEIERRMIPLPFPLTKEESCFYDPSRALALGIIPDGYTPLAQGLAITYRHLPGAHAT